MSLGGPGKEWVENLRVKGGGQLKNGSSNTSLVENRVPLATSNGSSGRVVDSKGRINTGNNPHDQETTKIIERKTEETIPQRAAKYVNDDEERPRPLGRTQRVVFWRRRRIISYTCMKQLQNS